MSKTSTDKEKPAPWYTDEMDLPDNHIQHKRDRYGKLTTDKEILEDAFYSYCDHISKGYPPKAWFYYHEKLSLTYFGMERYIKEKTIPVDFNLFELASALNFKHWFEIAAMSATGSNEKANVASIQMIMRNIHGWDKVEDASKKAEVMIDKIDEYLKIAKQSSNENDD